MNQAALTLLSFDIKLGSWVLGRWLIIPLRNIAPCLHLNFRSLSASHIYMAVKSPIRVKHAVAKRLAVYFFIELVRPFSFGHDRLREYWMKLKFTLHVILCRCLDGRTWDQFPTGAA